MEQLTIKKEKARRLYNESPEWFREELIETFGKKCFEKRDYKSIKSFEDACEALEIDLGSIFNKNDSVDEIAYKKLKVIIKAINQGWMPDWNDDNQRKWFPYFSLSSGFGFSSSGYYFDYTDTDVGSRLCFESEDKSTYAGNQFLELYKEFLD